jgi:folate-binding protein YgfZ
LDLKLKKKNPDASAFLPLRPAIKIGRVTALPLHQFHAALNGSFAEVNGMEVVAHYGNPLSEHTALRTSAGVLDLSFRSRLCVTGSDRLRFLNGQVTNNVKALKIGEGCYAALVTAKGKLQTDLNVYCLADEFLLDFEPGLAAAIQQRLEKYVIADDVQIFDVGSNYGLLSVQGPKATEIVNQLTGGLALPEKPMGSISIADPARGEIYCMNQPRTGTTPGFDLFVPVSELSTVAEKLMLAASQPEGRACGWQALEMVRIEAGIPRFGLDMDATNLPPEAGIEGRAVSYSKGCYIGQEVIARIRTYGQVAKSLRGLVLPDNLPGLPQRGDKLFHHEKEAGYITSALGSPALKRNIALGYVRREHAEPGTDLILRTAEQEYPVKIVTLPFDL